MRLDGGDKEEDLPPDEAVSDSLRLRLPTSTGYPLFPLSPFHTAWKVGWGGLPHSYNSHPHPPTPPRLSAARDRRTAAW